MSYRPPLPYGCIFREDFVNPTLAADNGLVITGNPWVAAGVRPTTGARLHKPKLNLRGTQNTVIFECEAKAFSGAAQHIFETGDGSRIFQAVFSGTANQWYIYWGGAGVAVDTEYTVKPYTIFAFSISGLNYAFFRDGVQTKASTLSSSGPIPGAVRTEIGANYSGALPLNRVLKSFRVYNYAMSAYEIAQDYRTIRGLQA